MDSAIESHNSQSPLISHTTETPEGVVSSHTTTHLFPPQFIPHTIKILTQLLHLLILLNSNLKSMGTDVDVEEQIMIGKNYREAKQIDPQRERFPCCIVYTPLPLLSWLIPFIGHVGICREDGVILDFAGPNFVSVDNFAFGSVTRYLQIDEKLCRAICMRDREPQNSSGYEVEISRWDDAIRLSTQEYQHRSYSLLTCNCHSFVANNLNRLDFRGHHWNVVSVAILMLFKAQWVNRAAILKTFLPFIIVFSLCVALGGSTFLKFWAMFLFLLVGWFILGSYCVTSLIEL